MSERLGGCREVEAAGRVERQKEGGKAGQGKGQDNVAQMAKKVGWRWRKVPPGLLDFFMYLRSTKHRLMI